VVGKEKKKKFEFFLSALEWGVVKGKGVVSAEKEGYGKRLTAKTNKKSEGGRENF